jgi:hypothetical protein
MICDANSQCQLVDLATESDSGCNVGASKLKPKRVQGRHSSNSFTGHSTESISVNSVHSKAARSKGNAPAKPSKVKSEGPISGASVETAYRSDVEGLPGFARAQWTASFLPTLYGCLASASNPWELYERDSNLVDTIQEIVDVVYPNSGYRVKLGDKIFMMV